MFEAGVKYLALLDSCSIDLVSGSYKAKPIKYSLKISDWRNCASRFFDSFFGLTDEQPEASKRKAIRQKTGSKSCILRKIFKD